MTGEKLTIKARVVQNGKELNVPDVKVDALSCAIRDDFSEKFKISMIADKFLGKSNLARLSDDEVSALTGGALTKAEDYKNTDYVQTADYEHDPETMKEKFFYDADGRQQTKEHRYYCGKRLNDISGISFDDAENVPQIVKFGYSLKPLAEVAKIEGKTEDEIYVDYISAPETPEKTYSVTFSLFDGDKKVTREDLRDLGCASSIMSSGMTYYSSKIEEIAKKTNYAPAQLLYGKATKDESFVKMASDQGYTPAMERYARDLLNMPALSAKQQQSRDKEAFGLMEKAAKKGSSVGEYWMGRMHELGRDGTGAPDYGKAFECYMWTTQMKDGKMKGAAYKKLAQLYAKGLGCEKDLAKSKECYAMSDGAQASDEFDKGGM